MITRAKSPILISSSYAKISLDYIIEQSQSKVENCVYLFINNDY